ncbi:hypothetical protein KR51_00032100 [Rubidibacter lacunae KORDI 51-2]|uniref:Acetyltransferase n=1 Tax=Rubidibacter lacunae KORDI 51-2 TaxID=582515 RepID=U5D6I5_9CHRO|nr:hypothetical protein KR51_00032100 [Rubidibacter lacunae KORDI 51-2]
MLKMLFEISARLGCYAVWILTERHKTAAMNLYGSIPGTRVEDTVMFTWTLLDDDGAD